MKDNRYFDSRTLLRLIVIIIEADIIIDLLSLFHIDILNVIFDILIGAIIGRGRLLEYGLLLNEERLLETGRFLKEWR